MNNPEYVLYTDGGSRGNPGKSAIGFVVFKNNEEVFRYNKYIGITTNNVAEYTALIYALTYLTKNQIFSATCYLDSELVVKQLNGVYKIKNDNISILADKVFILVKQFKNISFNHVLRDKNKIADSLVNKALDEVN